MDRDLRARIRGNIDRHGQHLHAVFLTKADPPDARPFVYTIGNHERGLPELLMIDVDQNLAASLLNRLGEIQRQQARGFADEERVGLGGKFALRVVDAGEIGRRQYASHVGVFYDIPDHAYEVRQILLPDTKGRWPDDPACDEPYSRQPVLSAVGRSNR